MADYILDVMNHTSKLDWAFPFQRTDAFPLDRSSLFSSYDDALLYAIGSGDERQLGGSSYVGQPISVYDETSNTVTLYLIETDRSLKEVGSVPVGDNLSVEVVNNTIQLKGYGAGYYKYIPAVKDETTGEIITPSSYEYTEGFIAGLEPRVVNNNNKLEIAWYEPSEETIESIGAKVESVEKILEEIQKDIGNVSDTENNIAATGIHKAIEDLQSNKANKNDVYTKSETDSAIATAVAGVDHLKRKIVNNIDEIVETAEDAHLYIYMVPTGLQMDDDKYDEYVVINGILEKVGSWEVDLSGYATKEELNNTNTDLDALEKTVSDNQTQLDEKILNLKNDLEDEIERATAAEAANAQEIEKKADKSTTLAGYGITDTYTKSEITDLIADITGGESAADVKAELIEFKTTTNATLQTIQGQLTDLSGAEPNFIKAVDGANFSVTDDGMLTLVSVSPSQVEGLQTILNSGTSLVTEEEKNALQNIIAGNYDNFITSITSDFKVENGQLQLINVQNSALMHIVGDMTNLTNYTEGTTLVDEINDVRMILSWQEMDNV